MALPAMPVVARTQRLAARCRYREREFAMAP